MISSRDTSTVPKELLAYLEGGKPDAAFSMRAMLVRDVISKQWAIMGAVVRPVLAGCVESRTFQYEHAVLTEQELCARDVVTLLQQFSEGVLKLAGESVFVSTAPSCEVTHVSIQNYWMEQAGIVYSIRAHSQLNAAHHERLIAAGAPYYPDPFEAARYWLGLRQHHGSSDSNNGHVVFLAPETRAFIAEASWPEENLLEVRVEGSLVPSGKLSILGAYWTRRQINHLAAPVLEGRAVVPVGSHAERLELFVLHADSVVCDFHKEDVAFPSSGRSILGLRKTTSAPAQLLQAIAKGEGIQTEFKEFLELSRSKSPPGEKEKLQQVLKTVVAFANTEGGTVYLGVSDSCEIVGAHPGVVKWVNGPADEAAVDSYMGALRAKVRDFIYPSVDLRTTAMHHSDRIVIALEVARAARPVSLTHDTRMYMRSGANNVPRAPADWRALEGCSFGSLPS